MCGLFGVVVMTDKADRRHAAALRALAFFNKNRGTHSYGLWNNKQQVLKEAKNVMEHGQAHLNTMAKSMKAKGDWVMGHTRQATTGGITDQNAHPFGGENGGAILAHNGVVTVDGYDEKDHAVDSARILIAAAKEGWEKAMSKTQGSCGLIVTDESDIFLYRHSQTLSFARTSWGVLISSDLDHLKNLAFLFGESVWEYFTPKEEHFYNLLKDEYTLHAPCKTYAPVKYQPKGNSKGYPEGEERTVPSYHRGAATSLTSQERMAAVALYQDLKGCSSIADMIQSFDVLTQYERRLLGDLFKVNEHTSNLLHNRWVSDLSGDTIPYTYLSDHSIAKAFFGSLFWDKKEKCLWLIATNEQAELRRLYARNVRDLVQVANGYYPDGLTLLLLEIMVDNKWVPAPSDAPKGDDDDDPTYPISLRNAVAAEDEAPPVEALQIKTPASVKKTQPLSLPCDMSTCGATPDILVNELPFSD